VTAFAFACAAILAVILAWTTLPLWRAKTTGLEGEAPSSPVERRWSTVLVVLLVPGLAIALYSKLSNWDWETAQAQASGEKMDVEQMLAQLEKKLNAAPDNVTGWLMLGRSYVQLGRFGRGVDAYQKAYDLTKGENVEALSGLGEALALMDQASLGGKAGQLFDEALKRDPNDQRGLWYGGMAALQGGNLRVGRDRFALLLQADNIPADMRTMLQSKVEELNGQLGEAGNVVPNGQAGSGPIAPVNPPASASAAAQAEPATNAAQQRSIRVAIKLAPNIKQQLSGPVSLFVLARDPNAPGPPLAVQRHASTELPLTVTLTEGDAMIPVRTIATVPRVTVVARLSLSGGPQARSGDFFGEATYEFSKNTGTVQITIDQRVP
jgi:cytochrome c-type biogenesis protein CcmH